MWLTSQMSPMSLCRILVSAYGPLEVVAEAEEVRCLDPELQTGGGAFQLDAVQLVGDKGQVVVEGDDRLVLLGPIRQHQSGTADRLAEFDESLDVLLRRLATPSASRGRLRSPTSALTERTVRPERPTTAATSRTASTVSS